jgi:hypothetical protein
LIEYDHFNMLLGQSNQFVAKSFITPIISDFQGSAVVSTASVGVPPTESSGQNQFTFWVTPQAHR